MLFITVARRFGRAAFLLMGLSIFVSMAEAADKVYEKPSVFMHRHFGSLPETQTLTLDSSQKSSLKEIFRHSFREKTVRYWQGGGKTAFILNEEGKSEPITIGVIVKAGRISEIKVLIYRESHGWEVSKAGFTKQFEGASYDGKRLSQQVDGIVGATLSVNAMKKVGAAALYLSTQIK